MRVRWVKTMNFLKSGFRTVVLVAGLAIAANASAKGLTDFSGAPKSISDYTGNGKWRIVMIWASDCHFCNKEAPNYVKFNQAHEKKDAQVLGISMDGKEKIQDAKDFIKRHHLNFPNLIGEPMNVAMEYMQLTNKNWVGTPSFLVYDPSGKLLAAEAGAVPVEVIENFIKSHTPKSASKS